MPGNAVAQQAPPIDSPVVATMSENTQAAPTPVSSNGGDQSCTAEIGPEAAARLVKECRSMSPATRPPCNARNSCALIRDEIRRSEKFNADATADVKADRGVTAEASPADVIRRYYAAIDRRDYTAAYHLWENDGQASGKSLTAFSRGFSHTSSSTVTIGTPGRPEGTAGSVYVTVPVKVEATLEDGTRQRFRGSYDLRRSNVPGPDASSRRWQLHSASLHRVE